VLYLCSLSLRVLPGTCRALSARPLSTVWPGASVRCCTCKAGSFLRSRASARHLSRAPLTTPLLSFGGSRERSRPARAAPVLLALARGSNCTCTASARARQVQPTASTPFFPKQATDRVSTLDLFLIQASQAMGTCVTPVSSENAWKSSGRERAPLVSVPCAHYGTTQHSQCIYPGAMVSQA